MERSRHPYAIYKRATKKKKNEFRFYVRFRGEDGRYLTGVSSGQSSRAAAAFWADSELTKGRIITPGERGATFGTFAEGFWNYDGDYITRRLARGGHFSWSFAVIRASQLKRLILPTFMDRTLSAITRGEIEAWQMKLFREAVIEPATINRCLDNLKVIMKEATRRGFIGADPAAGMERLAEELEALVLRSGYREPDDLVFPGYGRTVPLDKHRIHDKLKGTKTGEERGRRFKSCSGFDNECR